MQPKSPAVNARSWPVIRRQIPTSWVCFHFYILLQAAVIKLIFFLLLILCKIISQTRRVIVTPPSASPRLVPPSDSLAPPRCGGAATGGHICPQPDSCGSQNSPDVETPADLLHPLYTTDSFYSFQWKNGLKKKRPTSRSVLIKVHVEFILGSKPFKNNNLFSIIWKVPKLLRCSRPMFLLFGKQVACKNLFVDLSCVSLRLVTVAGVVLLSFHH